MITTNFGENRDVVALSTHGDALLILSEVPQPVSQAYVHIFNLKCECVGYIESDIGMAFINETCISKNGGYYTDKESFSTWCPVLMHDSVVDEKMTHLDCPELVYNWDKQAARGIFTKKYICFEDDKGYFEITPRRCNIWNIEPSNFNGTQKSILKIFLLLKKRVPFLQFLSLDLLTYIGNYLLHYFPVKKDQTAWSCWIKSDKKQKSV